MGTNNNNIQNETSQTSSGSLGPSLMMTRPVIRTAPAHSSGSAPVNLHLGVEVTKMTDKLVAL